MDRFDEGGCQVLWASGVRRDALAKFLSDARLRFLSIKKNTMVCEEAPALLLALVLLLAHTESAETADARGKNWHVPPRAPESAVVFDSRPSNSPLSKNRPRSDPKPLKAFVSRPSPLLGKRFSSSQ